MIETFPVDPNMGLIPCDNEQQAASTIIDNITICANCRYKIYSDHFVAPNLKGSGRMTIAVISCPQLLKPPCLHQGRLTNTGGAS